MAAYDKFIKTDKKPKVRYTAGDNTNVNPINGPIAKSSNPNVPGPGNNPGSTYTRASGTVLTEQQESSNRNQVRDQETKTRIAARKAAEAATRAMQKKRDQAEKDKKANRQIKPGTH